MIAILELDQVWVLSGVSGSGKSTALRALEDLGLFCMDNVPVSLVETVLTLCAGNEEVDAIALGIDAREGRFLEEVGPTLDHVAERAPTRILWIDARNAALIRRYSLTGRRHPLGDDIKAAVAHERRLLAELTRRATDRIDTTAMSPHELQQAIRELVEPGTSQPTRVRLQSFGFTRGVPPEASHVFDVRFLPNPFWEELLRPLSGRDPAIVTYMESKPEVGRYLEHLMPLVTDIVTLSTKAGRRHLSIAVGCTGGHHRSVFVIEKLAKLLRSQDVEVDARHRDLLG